MIDKHRLSHTGTFEISREKIAQVMAFYLALPVLQRMSFICHYVQVYFFLHFLGYQNDNILIPASKHSIQPCKKMTAFCNSLHIWRWYSMCTIMLQRMDFTHTYLVAPLVSKLCSQFLGHLDKYRYTCQFGCEPLGQKDCQNRMSFSTIKKGIVLSEKGIEQQQSFSNVQTM